MKTALPVSSADSKRSLFSPPTAAALPPRPVKPAGGPANRGPRVSEHANRIIGQRQRRVAHQRSRGTRVGELDVGFERHEVGEAPLEPRYRAFLQRGARLGEGFLDVFFPEDLVGEFLRAEFVGGEATAAAG